MMRDLDLIDVPEENQKEAMEQLQVALLSSHTRRADVGGVGSAIGAESSARGCSP